MGLLIMPHGRYPCKDGFVEYAGGEPVFWPRWVKMLEMPELLENPRFKDLADLSHRGEFEAIFLPWLVELTKREATEKAQKAGVPGAAIQTPKEVVNDPHFNERGFFVEIEHPEAGKIKYPGCPFKTERTSWEVRRPAPLLGQHNEKVYCDLLGYTKEDLIKLKAMGVI